MKVAKESWNEKVLWKGKLGLLVVTVTGVDECLNNDIFIFLVKSSEHDLCSLSSRLLFAYSGNFDAKAHSSPTMRAQSVNQQRVGLIGVLALMELKPPARADSIAPPTYLQIEVSYSGWGLRPIRRSSLAGEARRRGWFLDLIFVGAKGPSPEWETLIPRSERGGPG